MVVSRLRRMGHRGLQESFIVPPGLDELLIQLCEIIWEAVSRQITSSTKNNIPFFCEYFSMSRISFGRIAVVW